MPGDSVEAMSSGTCVECGLAWNRLCIPKRLQCERGSDGMDCPLGSDLRIWASHLEASHSDLDLFRSAIAAGRALSFEAEVS